MNEVDLDIEFMAEGSWDQDMPARMRWLRENDPVHWSEKDGVFVVSRYDDVCHVSKNQQLFTSEQGVRPGNPAKLGLIDEGGYMDDRRRMAFSYAHPIFWAPFSLIGDGGGAK